MMTREICCKRTGTLGAPWVEYDCAIMRSLYLCKSKTSFLFQQNKLFYCGKWHTLGSKVPSLRHQNNLFCCGTNMALVLKPLFLLVLMMALGGNKALGQTDYSGTYYIASGGKGEGSGSSYTYNYSTANSNFYLCPTEGWCYYKPNDDFSSDGTTYPNPFLTTYQCRNGVYDDSKAVWTVEKVPNSDYYYIKHNKDGKYMVSNGKIRTTTNPDRIRVHLESIDDPATQGDKVLFDLSNPSGESYIEISPKGITDETDGHDLDHDNADHTAHRWLTVNNGNYNYLVGRSGKTGGPTGYEYVSGIICIYSAGDKNAPFYLEEIVSRPVINYGSDNNTIEITHSEENVTIYYTTDGTNPTTTNYVGTGSEITNVNSSVTIKAIAAKSQDGMSLPTLSPVAEIRVVPSANITFVSSPIVYNGSAQEPTVIVKDGETEIPSDEYTVSYSNNNIKAGETVTVTITDNEGGNYIVYGSTTFTILRKGLDSDDIDISVTKDEDAYNIVVKDGEETLTKGEDKDYTQNIEAPTANQEVTITGVGNYNGSVTIKVLDFDAIENENETAAAYVATQNLTTPTGMTAYIVSGIDVEHNAVEIEAVPYIPKDEAVLLLAETNLKGFQLKPYDGETTAISGNQLKVATGTDEQRHKDLAQVYVYYQGEFVLTMEGTLSEGKFYLDNPGYSTGAPSMAPLRIVKGNHTTEMKGIREHHIKSDIWYSLDGRLLTGRPTEKGLYMNNHHKVVVK